MNFFRTFRICKVESEVISAGSSWCCSYDGVPGFLHIADNLPSLIWQVITEFRNDRHLVGY